MSYSTLRLHKYERRKRWVTYLLEFYIAFIFCIHFFVPFLIKLFDAISMDKAFWQFDASYFRIFTQQQSMIIDNTVSIWPLLADVFTTLCVASAFTILLGALLANHYQTYYDNCRLLVYEVMIMIVSLQLLGAILGVTPFIVVKLLGYAGGLYLGHSFADIFKSFTNPLQAPFTFKQFFYLVEEDEEKKEKSS